MEKVTATMISSCEGSEEMLLGKSCSSKYHIKKGTLKLGTLYEYRTIENEELVDQHEGKLEFHINFHGHVRIPTYWFNTFSSGGIGFGNGERLQLPGRTSGRFNTVRAKNINNREMELIESKATISREALNSFIFCMSKVRKTSECHDIFKGCDDYWYIKETQIEAFATSVANNLADHIREMHAQGNYIVPKQTNMDRLAIGVSWGEVQYVGREIHVYNNGFMTLEDFKSKIEDMAYTKPDSYSSEKEFRFNFQVLVDGYVVEPIVKSVFLNSAALLKHVFWL